MSASAPIRLKKTILSLSGLFGAVRDFLLGHDVFVSYARLDGREYALGMARRLQGEGFRCYLDQFAPSPGRKITPQIRSALKRSRALVVVGTQGAAVSEAVEDEIRFFSAKPNPIIIALDFGECVRSAPWFDLIRGVPVLSEEAEAIGTGNPSDRLWQSVLGSCDFTRRATRLWQTFWATASAMLVVIVTGFWLAKLADGKRARAEAQAWGLQEISRYSLQSFNALEEFERHGDELNALEDAQGAVSGLGKIKGLDSASPIFTRPTLILKRILDRIHERKRIPAKADGIVAGDISWEGRAVGVVEKYPGGAYKVRLLTLDGKEKGGWDLPASRRSFRLSLSKDGKSVFVWEDDISRPASNEHISEYAVLFNEDGRPIETWRGNFRFVFDKSSGGVAVADSLGRVFYMDGKGKEKKRVPFKAASSAMSLSGDGRFLASGGERILEVWILGADKVSAFTRQDGSFLEMAFTSKSNRLITKAVYGFDENPLGLDQFNAYDIRTGKMVDEWSCLESGRPFSVNPGGEADEVVYHDGGNSYLREISKSASRPFPYESEQVVFSPDGKARAFISDTLYAVMPDQTAKILSCDSKSPSYAGFSATGKLFGSIERKAVRIFDLSETPPRPMPTLEVSNRMDFKRERISEMAFGPDGGPIVLGKDSLWRFNRALERKEVFAHGIFGAGDSLGEDSKASLDPTGRFAYIRRRLSRDDYVWQAYGLVSGGLEHLKTVHFGDYFDFAVSLDGKRVGLLQMDGRLSVLDVEHGFRETWCAKVAQRLDGFSFRFGGVALDFDGNGIAYEIDRSTIGFLDSRGVTSVYTEELEGVQRIAFHPASRMVAITSQTGVVRLIDKEGVLPSKAFRHNRFDGARVAFDPSGRYLAIASKEIRIWTVDGQFVDSIPCDAGRIVFSPEASVILAGGIYDGGYYLFQLAGTDFKPELARAQAWLHSPLPPDSAAKPSP
jgi:WD40 repeat protein